jgi:sugar-specific transcriptional regulator TrmB
MPDMPFAKAPPATLLQDAIEPVTLLGFTELEAMVYAFLVQHSPATGYKISRAIGKPIANTYKAIEALQRKGAVLVDETGNRMCRALPPEDLLERAERTFRQRHQEAKRALSRIPKATHDDGIYGLSSTEQVYDRCRKMLTKAKEVAVLDLFPGPLAELKPAILACARRGVRMAVQVYDPVTLAGVEVVRHGQADIVLQKWDGHWLNCVIDGAELLIAFMAKDGETVHQAIWSRSPFLCSVFGSALGAELLASSLQRAVLEHWADEDVRETIVRFGRFRAHELPAYRELTSRRSKNGKTRKR